MWPRSLPRRCTVSYTQLLVLEGDPAHTLSQNPLYLVPEYGDSSIASSLESGKKYVAVPIAQSIETLEAYRDSLTMTPILVTSDSSYEKADLQNMESYAKEAGDQEGPFTIGMEVTEMCIRDRVCPSGMPIPSWAVWCCTASTKTAPSRICPLRN